MEQKAPRRRRGFSVIELLVVIGIVGILAIVVSLGLSGRRNKVDLDNTVRQIAATFREAQSRSLAQEGATSWGVHLENSTTTAPFYAIFKTSYATSTTVGYWRLPNSVAYATSSLAQGAYREITFSQISGLPSASTSVSIYLLTSSAQSYTISVASSGAVSF